MIYQTRGSNTRGKLVPFHSPREPFGGEALGISHNGCFIISCFHQGSSPVPVIHGED
jgi:hypothetical protein